VTSPSGGDVHLTRAEFALLEALARSAGRVCSRDELLDAMGRCQATPLDRTIDQLIVRLRRKIEPVAASPRLIVTVPGFGYKLSAECNSANAQVPFMAGGCRPSMSLLAARREAVLVTRTGMTRTGAAVIVLPFRAADADSETLAASFTEDLVADLACAADMPVIAGGAAAGEAARRLGSGALGGRYAVAGSIRREGSTLRISAHLTDAADGARLWTERASIELDNSTGHYSVLARFVHDLKVQLRIAEGVRLELAGANDCSGLVACGRAILLRSYGPESVRLAGRYFGRALALDPGSVDAMAALGLNFVRNVAERWSDHPETEERRGELLLQQAQLVARDHPEATIGLGVLLRWQGLMQEALKILRFWAELKPGDPIGLMQLGVAIMYLGRPAEALPCLECALEAGVNDPDVGDIYWSIGACYQLLGHADEALGWLLKARARNVHSSHIPLRLAAVFGQLGEHDVAQRELAVARSLIAPPYRAELATLDRYRAQRSLRQENFIIQAEPTLYAGLRKAGMAEA
jgi:TolB-like protein